MIKNKKKPELLAPAGNIDSFYAVLRAGADAVYLAGTKYGARAYADNFSEDEICACIRYAHLYNKRVYLTVNTLVTDKEIDELSSFLSPMYEAGLDGVIVQDLGVISYIKEHFPEIEIHASTQLNTTGIEGVEYLKKLGVCRVVPARELSLNEIKEIKKSTGMELECFIHGAICYSYSGQCLFSSVIGSRSGNRGRCAQPCRLPYSRDEKRNVYPLSLKDMCTIEYLPQLIDAQIDSFKIEGRMKKPEYAAGVTALYRKYIDQYFEKGSISVTPKDKKTLSSLYIRSQVSEGYYEKYNGADMITIDNPSYSSSDIDIINEIHSLYVGNEAKKNLPKIKIEMSGYFMEGERAYISVSYKDLYIIKYGDIVDTAQKRAISNEDILRQINKLGATPFEIDIENTIDNIFLSDSAYYNLKGINELRRQAVAELEEQLINSYGLTYSRNTFTASNTDINEIKSYSKHAGDIRRFSILINDSTQLNAVLNYIEHHSNPTKSNLNVANIYIPEELFIDFKSNAIDTEFIDLLSSFYKKKSEVSFFIAMPYIRRMKDYYCANKIIESLINDSFAKNDYDNFLKGVLVRNLEDINIAQKLKTKYPKLEIALDYGIYTWNKYALSLGSSYASTIGMPIELCGAAQKEIAAAATSVNIEKQIYGRIPLMHTANCINKTLGKCIKSFENNSKNWTQITDRTQRQLPVFTDCFYCQNTIYNAVPLTLTKELNNYPDSFTFRIDFTNESVKEINDCLDYYLTNSTEPNWEYTKAFEKHSTE